MPELCVNGETMTLEDVCTIGQALEILGYGGRQYAVAVNGTFVPRHRHDEVVLDGGESLEILAPMQGG